jgi:methylated-DNA-[protein]-cysteine S-methyltransferase
MADGKERYDAVIASPLGRLGIVADKAVRRIDFVSSRTALAAPRSPVARRTVRQLRDYFRNPSHAFRLPLAPVGTAFQRRVWRALQRIPAGRVLTYGGLATKLMSGARAVGGACGANPLPIVIPCHRVVSQAGLGGYSGGVGRDDPGIKRWLLRHEGRGEF